MKLKTVISQHLLDNLSVEIIEIQYPDFAFKTAYIIYYIYCFFFSYRELICLCIKLFDRFDKRFYRERIMLGRYAELTLYIARIDIFIAQKPILLVHLSGIYQKFLTLGCGNNPPTRSGEYTNVKLGLKLADCARQGRL